MSTSPSSQPDSTPAGALLDLIGAAWMSRAIGVAAELSLADALAPGPATAEQLAQRTGAQTDPLRQLLGALATLEVVRILDDGRFELAPRGDLLRHDHPQSLRAWAIWAGAECWPMWQHLATAVRTGRGIRSVEHGKSGFAHLDADAPRAAVFNLALRQLTALAAPAIVRAIDWTGANTIADIGGGHGTLLVEALAALPAARGILFDLKHAQSGAEALIRARGLSERCRFMAGDFFESLPAGADVYLLKTVIHDWSDHDAQRILRVCREAMGPASRLLIIERLMPERPTPRADHRALARSDLHMLAAHGASERTERQFRDLLTGSGFTVRSIVPAGAVHSVIESVRA